MSDESNPLEAAAQQRRETVARAIEDRALALFAERPMPRVTVEEIAQAAGISLRTFYRYFATKELVFAGLPRRGAERIARAMLAEPASVSPFESLERAVRGVDRILEGEHLGRWLRALALSDATDHLVRMALMTTTSALTSALGARVGLPPDDPWVDAAGSIAASALAAGVRQSLRRGDGDLAPHLLNALAIAGRGLRIGPAG